MRRFLLFILLPWWGSLAYFAGPAEAQEGAGPTLNPQAIGLRIRLGLGDKKPTRWDGSLTVAPGEVLRLEGWRFIRNDRIEGTSWRAMSRRRRLFGRAARRIPPEQRPVDANGIIAILAAPEHARVEVTTQQGDFAFTLSEVPWGRTRRFLEERVAVERVAASVQITRTETENDFPAAATAPDGTVWVAYVGYTLGLPERAQLGVRYKKEPENFDDLATPPGGDQVFLLRCRNGQWSEPLALTDTGQDVYRPTVTVDREGTVWVIWSANVNGNWDLYGRRVSPNLQPASEVVQLTSDPGPDLFPVAATDAQGAVWLAWQGFRGDNANILALTYEGQKWSDVLTIAASPRNEWAPAIACATSGAVAIAWDTYQKGDYDVYFRERLPGQGFGEPVPVAATLNFEVRPALVYDQQNRLWIAWEESPPGWGKDWGALDRANLPLYRNRTVQVRCWAEGRLQAPVVQPLTDQPPFLQQMNSFARLGVDAEGRVWLVFRHRQGLRTGVGTTWLDYATTYLGDHWSPLLLLPDTDGILDNRPALTRGPEGHLLVVSNSDGRQHRGLNRGVKNDLWALLLPPAFPRADPVLKPVPPTPAPTPLPSPPPETEDVARLRNYRVTIGGRTYQLLRGEFHRHTEISGDGGGDGPLVDMFRYGLDAAALDWIGCGDHDNGGGREYPWWITQKLSDAFQVGPHFVPMFTYERSVRYPDGHRNPMFARRGIRTLPRLAPQEGEEPKPNKVSVRDTPMLYRYLKQFNGICAVHTSATDMGTDWRDNDPEVEPVVEIYQGCRQSYEYEGAPRSGNAQNSLGGWRPAGFVWNALAKGYRLGFQASSDHISTHISYAMVFVEEPTREAILNAFKQRHCYGATDNILVDVRLGEHLMGEEFTVTQPPQILVHIEGTATVTQVDIVRDNHIVYTTQPNQRVVDFTWRDTAAPATGVSYYYVRVMQANEEIAWASPLWLHFGE